MEAAGIRPSLKAHGRARRRLLTNRFAQLVATAAAFGAVAVLGIVVFNVDPAGDSRAQPRPVHAGAGDLRRVRRRHQERHRRLDHHRRARHAVRAPDRSAGRDLRLGVRARAGQALRAARARRPERRAVDRDRHLRLRAARRRVPARRRGRRRSRSRSIMLPARLAGDDRGAGPRPQLAARGQLRTRRGQVADGAVRDPPDRSRRDPHRLDAGGRRAPPARRRRSCSRRRSS